MCIRDRGKNVIDEIQLTLLLALAFGGGELLWRVKWSMGRMWFVFIALPQKYR